MDIYEIGLVITIPSFILRFTCPKTLDLSGFSPFYVFVLHNYLHIFRTLSIFSSSFIFSLSLPCKQKVGYNLIIYHICFLF
mgnify:FL=1